MARLYYRARYVRVVLAAAANKVKMQAAVGRILNNDGIRTLNQSTPAICSTKSTMRRRSLLFLMRMNALVSESPSDVARKSAT